MKKYYVEAIDSFFNEVVVSFKNIQARDNLEAMHKAQEMLEGTILERRVHNFRVVEMK